MRDQRKKNGNFDHLAELDAPLARLGGLSERFFMDDANTSLIKSRQFAERMAREVGERLGLDLDPAADFVAVLGALRSDGSVTKDVLDVFHRIRKAGNAAVHGHDDERREAFEALKRSHRLGVWFRATVSRRGGEPGFSMLRLQAEGLRP